VQLKNRVIRSGCYEGLARNGTVTDELIENHRLLAAGGIAMTTVGYFAVSFDGRGFSHELWARGCNRCFAAMDGGGVVCVSATRGLVPRDAW
jgi:2,4-dienoyl-CoA reductase-like NADH-dependent reductase (Old Yellow Enzyme family)